MPILLFALFGKVLMASGLRAALTEALKNAEVLVTGVFAASGWLLSSYLDNVNKRFDKVDNNVNKRFENMDNNVNKRFENMDKRFEITDKRFEITDNNVNKQIQGLTDLLMPRRAAK